MKNKRCVKRRTKIIATLGPATEKIEVLEKLVVKGVDLVRINFSHGDKETHLKQAATIKKLAKKYNTRIGILMDLQGPKIRTLKFQLDSSITLREKENFILSCTLQANMGTKKKIGVCYKELYKDLKKGNELVLDDGRIILQVKKIVGKEIHTKVKQGGVLGQNKGINLRGGGLSAGSLTSKDKEDIKTAVIAGTDYLALSFTRSAADIKEIKKILKKIGSTAGIVAKIERAEALPETIIQDIIQESDAIMVARGDLGVEIGDAMLPAQQKRLITLARMQDTAVIIATQMMESMIENPMPTRAETFDVANAVMDGTDAVMLSAETAIGKYPDKVVSIMSDICLEAENSPTMGKLKHAVVEKFSSTEESIALSAMYVANRLKVKAIVSLTESGNTPKTISRTSSSIPIFAFSRNNTTLNRITLFRGVFPFFLSKDQNWDAIDKSVLTILKEKQLIVKGDKIVFTKGISISQGSTNTLKILNAL